ncbi:MAG: aminoglycoside phosphotransferase family protein [Alicyclobacillus sp.]|nr:aminoglycoside phosphotransferase family protein [Alicyclobacillus sp.]
MREPKPYWRDVPATLRKQIEDRMGARIRHAVRVFGGYGPSATFRIFFDNGQTVFAKGAGNTSNAHNWEVVPKEAFVYENIEAIEGLAPKYFGAVAVEGWHLLLLEDLRDVKRVPPWSSDLAERAIRDIAGFHLRALAEADKLEIMPAGSLVDSWKSVRDHDAASFLNLFGLNRAAAEEWLDEAIDALDAAASRLMDPGQPWGLIHIDIRSDNLIFRRDGRLVLFDWPLTARGPLIGDIAFFLPSIRAEGGPDPSALMRLYRQTMAENGITIPDGAVQAAAAATAGYFASRAGRPPVEGLPRLRQVQLLQLRAALPWAAAELGLAAPPVIP